MKFNTNVEIKKEFSVFDEGVYKFTVLEATEQLSKSGNEMIKLKLEFENESNQISTVYDYLVAPFPKKIAAFAQTTNKMDKFEKGELLADDCVGLMGYAQLEISEYETEKWDMEKQENVKVKYKNNKVKFYKNSPPKSKEETKFNSDEFDDSVIPF